LKRSVFYKSKNEIKMFDTIKNLLGLEKTDFPQLVKEGAIILDVRSKGEFAGGHIKGSINISVDQLSSNLHKLKDKSKPIITCCASGMRSASAKSILKSNGYTEVYNGGGWSSLQNKIS
jgi:rhodanese-related sulfurtransferase